MRGCCRCRPLLQGRWARWPKTAKPQRREGRRETRLIAARVLTVLAVLLALVGMVAFYVENTALDPDGFETISRNMIENDAIRTQVANTAVDQLYANVDVEAAIAERLPPAQKGWPRFWRVSRARARIGRRSPRSNGRACRRCGSR